MKVEIVPVPADRKPVLLRLLQLYIHDFSEIDGTDVDAEGRYDYTWVNDGSYWTDPARHPFFITVDDRLAGFALVNAGSVRDTPGVRCVAEFFVMRKYRSRGVGRTAARAVFAALPGRWEIAVMKANTAGQAFWRKAVADATGGAFTEDFVDNDVWEGPVLSFAVPAPTGRS